MGKVKENIIYRKISELKKLPNNPRICKGEMFDKLVSSIKKFGVIEGRPFLLSDRTGEIVIIGGNQRFEACKKLGIEEVPTFLFNGLTEEEEKEIIIRDNISNGDWNNDLLLKDWDGKDLNDWGLDIEFINNDEAKEEIQDDVPDVKEEIIVKKGDLFQLGDHIIICGDSLNVATYELLLGDVKIDLGFNDPPYGMKLEKKGVEGDNKNFNELLQFNKDWIYFQISFLKENGSLYIWGIDEPLMDIHCEIMKPLIKKQKATFRNLITRDKGSGQGQTGDKHRSYVIADEKCLFYMMGVQGFNNNADNYFELWENIRYYLEKEIKKIGESDKKIANSIGFKDGRTVNHWRSKSQWLFITKDNYNKLREYAKTKSKDIFKKEYDEIKKEYEELKKEYYATRSYFNNTHDNFNNVWHIKRASNEERKYIGGHYTPKPIELCERAIKSSCPVNGTVIDSFLGSGSTLISCEKTNRKCFGIESQPKYIQTVIKRFNYYTDGKKEIKCLNRDINIKSIL